MNKKRKIREELEMIEKRLANADAYVTNGVNVKGSGSLHFTDWRGNSGHPLWMQNVMIPATKRAQTRLEKRLEAIANKEREKQLKQRRRKEDIC